VVLASVISGVGAAEGRPRRRRVVGAASRSVSAAFLRVVALGALRIFTAASVRVAAAVLRVAVGFAAALLLPALVPLVARGLRVAAVCFSVRVPRLAVVLAAVLRVAVAAARGFLVSAPRAAEPRVWVLRPADVARAVPRFGASVFAARVEVRVVAFAAVARVRVAEAVVVLRADVLRVVAGAVRLLVPRVAAVLPRAGAAFVVVLVVRVPEVLDVARVGLFAVLLVLRAAVDLPAGFLPAVERAVVLLPVLLAVLLAVRVVRDAVPRPVVAADRRPPALTAIARVRRAGVLSSSLLMMWSLPGGSAVI
jgi:hypothetical protein